MRNFKLLGAVGVICLTVSCGSPRVAVVGIETADSLIQPTSTREDALALEIHDEVNRYRASNGMRPLERHAGLANLAGKHSGFMRDNAGKFGIEGKLISHYGVDSRRFLAEKKYGIGSVGENVLASYNLGLNSPDLAKTMVKGWVNSPNNKHNLDLNWASSGIAVRFDSAGRAFVTQLFGSEKTMVTKIGGPSGW